MKIVGIIGPYFSGGNRRLIDHNIANAQYVAIAIANYFAKSNFVGFFAPHIHTARFEKLAEAPESYYHALDDAFYDNVCEAVVMIPGWTGSIGAKRDKLRAEEQNKKIFFLMSFDDECVKLLLESLETWALEKTTT